MNQAILIAKNGTRIVDREELERIDAPPPTSTWKPIKHDHVLSLVEHTLEDAGFQVQKSELALSSDSHRFFGTLTLGTQVHDGVALAVGVRSSTDKSFPLGLVAGNRVFVCSNLAFSAEIYVSKRHTKFGGDRFRDGISQAVMSLQQYRQSETARIERMRESEIDDDHANSLILQAYEQKVVSHLLLPQVIEEYRHPKHEEFASRTRWSLLNSFTEVLKVRQNNPAAFAALTIRLQALLDVPILSL